MPPEEEPVEPQASDRRPSNAAPDWDARPLPQELALGHVLNLRKAAEGSWSALAHAITASVPPEERCFSPTKLESYAERGEKPVLIERRRLKAIEQATPSVALTLRELGYLDRYLERFGEGLAHRPIFGGADLLAAVAETGRVDFLLGTKPESERQNISHWDVLALAEIQRGIQASKLPVRMDIHDVPLRPTDQETRASLEAEPLSSLLRDDGNSLVVIGSSRINPAADAVLSRMFGRRPFSKAHADKQGLPFHFVWDQRPYVYDSALHFGAEDIRGFDANVADLVERREYAALAVGDRVYLDELSGRERNRDSGETFGICAVQRRERGQLWVVVSGVTGVSTYVGAKLVSKLPTHLHEPHTGKASPVYWGLVSVKVREHGSRPLAGQREFHEERITAQPERAGDGGPIRSRPNAS